MRYWLIENINANTTQGNEIKRLEIKMYGKVVTTNDKWATTNWGARVGAVEKTKAQAQAILDDRRSTVTAEWDNHPRSPGGQPERVVLP